jgi:thiamine biosynthesis protein ThiS
VSKAIPRLMLVTDARRSRYPLLDLAASAVAGGVDAIYLRDITLPGEDLAELARNVRERVGPGVSILVNGGPEAARAAGGGLHLREHEMAPAAARALMTSETTIGKSVHDPAGAASASGADYLLAGHVFPSRSKPGKVPLGLAGLTAIASAAPCPVLAIGGITPERVAEVVLAGARGIAVIGAIVEADDPRAAAGNLCTALDRALADRPEEQVMHGTDKPAAGGADLEIVVNGKNVSVPGGSTIHDFLASKRMTDAMAIVERNGEIVPRAAYGDTGLQSGDRLEVVHAVGGG